MLYRCLEDGNCLKTILLVFLCHYDHIESYIDKFKLFWICIHVGLLWSWNSCVKRPYIYAWVLVLLHVASPCLPPSPSSPPPPAGGGWEDSQGPGQTFCKSCWRWYEAVHTGMLAILCSSASFHSVCLAYNDEMTRLARPPPPGLHKIIFFRYSIYIFEMFCESA